MSRAFGKRVMGVLLCSFLFSVCGAQDRTVSGAETGGVSGELVKNGGFEEGGKKVPASWSRDEKRTGKSGRLSLDRSKKHSGSWAVKLEPNGRNDSNDPLAVYQVIPAASLRGQTVQFSAFLAAEGGATAGLGMLTITGSGPKDLQMVTQQGDWESRSATYKVPDDPAAQLVVICLAGGQSGSAWCDDVSVTTGAGGAASQAMATQSPSGTQTASISVDAGRVIRAIPRTLYGANIEWIWNANMAFDEGARRVNPEVVRLARDLGVTLIRYPGGVFSDFYHWKNGVGPAAQRPEVMHEPGTKDKTRPNFGTDEALAFAASAGAQLLITVNAGTGTAQEAADWVRYVNRDQLRVRYWEIGNELYIRDNSPASKAASLAPDAYAARFLEFARAMRAADPRIKIGAIGGVNQGAYAFVKDPNWNRIVLERAGKEIDFFAVHNAYAPLVGNANPDLRKVYRGMFAAPILIARNLQAVSDDIRRYAADDAGRIRIAVTEWGPAFQFGPGSPYVDHAKTLGSALFVASALKTFLEAPRTDIANYFLLNDMAVLGLIASRNADFPPRPDWIPTARYYALQLYTRHFGDKVVSSTATGPTFNSEAVGLMQAVRDVPVLDVVASLSDDGRQLYILGINRSFDDPVDAALEVRGFTPGSSGVAWTLNGTGIDANTGTKPLEIPGVKWGRQAEDPQHHRFARGAMSEVTLQSSPVANTGARFRYRFPAHSATSIVLSRAD